MTARVTEAQVRERLAGRGDVLLVDYCGRVGGKSLWRCTSCGHEWQATADKVANGGRGCPPCSYVTRAAARAMPEAEVRRQAAARTDVVLVEYAGTTNRPRSLWRCTSCGHEWRTATNSVLNGGTRCLRCYASRIGDRSRLDERQVRERVAERRPDLVLVEYAGSAMDRSSLWRCQQGHEWRQSWTHIKSHGSGCQRCLYESLALTADDVRRRLYGRTDVVLVQWAGNTQAASSWRCTSCESVWHARGKHVLGVGSGCPSCSQNSYRPDEPAVLYLLAHEGDAAWKVGVTNSLEARMRDLRADGWRVTRTWSQQSGTAALAAETAVLSQWRDARLPPGRDVGTDGYTETVAMASYTASEVIEQIEQARTAALTR